MPELITIMEAAERGIERLRKPIWAASEDHLKIDIIDGKPGLWLHLFSPFNKECNGRDPVDFIATSGNLNAREFEPYRGPTPDSEVYKGKVAVYDGCLSFEGQARGRRPKVSRGSGDIDAAIDAATLPATNVAPQVIPTDDASAQSVTPTQPAGATPSDNAEKGRT